MTPRVSTFSLRLPISLKAAVERMAAADGTSVNQFLDREAALAFLSRGGGETPRSEDEILKAG
jgi:hypothetical protein